MRLTSHSLCSSVLQAIFIIIPAAWPTPAKAQPAGKGATATAPVLSGVPVFGAPATSTRRAPLAPPPINDVSRAYEFRTRLLGDPQCQRFASESDRIFLDSSLDDAQKIEQLKALGNQAQSSGCLAP